MVPCKSTPLGIIFFIFGCTKSICPTGTCNPTIWQNNVNLFFKMLKYSSSNKFDKEFINKRIDEISIKEPNKI